MYKNANNNDTDDLPLEQFGEVVNRTTRAEEDEMFLLSMTTQKANEIIQFLIWLTNLHREVTALCLNISFKF